MIRSRESFKINQTIGAEITAKSDGADHEGSSSEFAERRQRILSQVSSKTNPNNDDITHITEHGEPERNNNHEPEHEQELTVDDNSSDGSNSSDINDGDTDTGGEPGSGDDKVPDNIQLAIQSKDSFPFYSRYTL